MATLPTSTRSRPPASGPRTDLSATVGWSLVAIITLLVLASWLPSLTAGLGDNHEGRILARHALNVQNAQADGLAASGWLSDWSPYAGRPEGDQTSYAHHPPLMNFGYYLTGQLLPVALPTAMRMFAYLSGVAMLPLGAAVARRLGFRWIPVLLGTVAVAVTPLFWVYGRLSGSTTLLVAMTLMIVRLRERREIDPAELAIAAAVSLAAVVAGYLGLATAALLGLVLLASRGLDRTTVVIGAAMAVGAAITLAYVVGGTGIAEVGDQVQVRTQGGGFTTAEFLERIGTWATSLLPAWWRWVLLPAALVAGVADRRSRAVTLVLAIVAAAYVFGLPNGSFIHDYWIFPVLLPVWFGAVALGEWAETRLDERGPPAVAAAAALIVLLGVAGLLRNDVPSTSFGDPEAAGELARTTEPPPEQAVAWRTSGLSAPRWLSLYWDLPPAQIGEDDLAQVADDELVFISLGRAPGWVDVEAVRDTASDLEGGYAVTTGAQLRALVDASG